jgi:hypothetical protein
VLLGIIAAAGAPFALAYSAAALWGSPRPATLLIATAAALTMSAAVLFTLARLRTFHDLREPED